LTIAVGEIASFGLFLKIREACPAIEEGIDHLTRHPQHFFGRFSDRIHGCIELVEGYDR
jgi:hypothetical protein